MKKQLLGVGIVAAIIAAVIWTQPSVHVAETIPEEVIPGKVLEGSASAKDLGVHVVSLVPMGYSGNEAYAWAWMADYTQGEDGALTLQTAASMPVVIARQENGGVMMQEPGDAEYAEMVHELFPRKIRGLFDTAEEHNALVAEAEAKAQQLAAEYFAATSTE